MTSYICATCGTQFSPATQPPASCSICADERQYVPESGQRWTTLDALRSDHRNALQRLEPDLYGIGTTPSFAIGQRALLIRTPHGNVLWDCISLLDDATVDIINALGGIHSIAISHPHFYTTMVEWARAFNCPVLLHSADRRHAMHEDSQLQFWQGDTHPILDGLTLIRLGGHFAGGTVLHWANGAMGRGAILSGDIIQVVADTRWVSFMRSYPNLIPLPAAEVERMTRALDGYEFDRIYGAWWDRVVMSDAKAALGRSSSRYVKALSPDALSQGK
jgi:hypothetical protein